MYRSGGGGDGCVSDINGSGREGGDLIVTVVIVVMVAVVLVAVVTLMVVVAKGEI